MSLFETLAELQEFPAEAGELIADLAAQELDAGRAEVARSMLEGLVVASPEDATAWTLLARAHRRLAQPLAARFCAEVAATLAPADAGVRLLQAESLLPFPEERARARDALAGLAGETGGVGERARALLAALPP